MLVNEEDPVKAQLVDERITPCWPRPTWRSRGGSPTEGGNYLDLLIDGGKFDVLGQTIQILGLRATARDPRRAAAGAAAGRRCATRSTR